jgi:hypothetical protein
VKGCTGGDAAWSPSTGASFRLGDGLFAVGQTADVLDRIDLAIQRLRVESDPRIRTTPSLADLGLDPPTGGFGTVASTAGRSYDAVVSDADDEVTCECRLTFLREPVHPGDLAVTWR